MTTVYVQNSPSLLHSLCQSNSPSHSSSPTSSPSTSVSISSKKRKTHGDESSLSSDTLKVHQNGYDTKIKTIEEEIVEQRIAKVRQAIQDFKDGKFLIVADSETRENEGDLIISAEKITAANVAFMVNQTSGIICVGCTGSRLEELKLPQMVEHNTESHKTAFTVSIDYKYGTTTGISASDRAITFRALTDSKTKPEDFARPGHVFPLRAREGGVLVRPGHTEASVDLARLAGFTIPAGVISEIVNKDGSMKHGSQLKVFATKHQITLITVDDLIFYRQLYDPMPIKQL